MKGKVQTVCGLVEPHKLGRTLTHEHLSMEFDVAYWPASPEDKHMEECQFNMKNLGWIRQNPYSHKPNLRINESDVNAAILDELNQYKKLGGGTIVENTTFGITRDVSFYQQAANKTGVNIVAGTGYYVNAAQKQSTLGLKIEEMVEFMTRELTVGCDGDPGILCGIIGELGCSWPLYDFERRHLQAAGETQSSTGCPVMVHPGRHHDAPEEILHIYQEAGGNVDKLVLAHLDRTIHNMDALIEFASLGSYCEYDLFGIETSHYQLNQDIDMPSDAQRIERIKHLVDNGFQDKILIAHDIHTKHRLEAYGGHGFSHILRSVVPKMLQRGLSQDHVDKIFISNPIRWLTFAK